MTIAGKLQFNLLNTDPGSPFAGRLVLWARTDGNIYYKNSAGTVTAVGIGGSVTNLSIVTANGITGSVSTSTSTPAITLALGAITPSSVVSFGTVTGSNLSGTNTGDQTITLTSDLTGTGTGSFVTALSHPGVTAGTYHSSNLVVDAKGRITSASNGLGGGSITSIAMSVPSIFSISGSPITTSGTFAVTLSGTALPVANGGTANTTKAAAFNTLSPLTTTGDIIYSNSGGSATRLGIGSSGQWLTVVSGVPSWAPSVAQATLVAVKPSTTSRTSATPTADPDLTFTMSAGVWSIDGFLNFSQTAGTGIDGFRVTCAHSGTYTNSMWAIFGTNSGSKVTTGASPRVFGTVLDSGSIDNNVSQPDYYRITGTVNVSISGIFAINWSQVTAFDQCNLAAGSWLIATKVG